MALQIRAVIRAANATVRPIGAKLLVGGIIADCDREALICAGADDIGLRVICIQETPQHRGLPGMWWPGICMLLWLCGALGLAAQTPSVWEGAARTIRRLPPDSFPQLPPAIRAELQARGCHVPQSFTSERPHNVVAGSFAHAGQQDWAALCSRQGSSSVLIFWGDAEAGSPAEFARRPDAAFLQGLGEGRIGYSRLLAAASPARLCAYAASADGALPNVLDHDGVEDAFAGKASVVWYLEAGSWLALTGAD